MNHYGISALSVGVFENYELAWTKAYGRACPAASEPATSQTLFLAGSISKSVNALATLLAVADGELALDAPIDDALQSWKLQENEFTRTTPVTLRQLLSHTAARRFTASWATRQVSRSPPCSRSWTESRPANTPPVRVDRPPGAAFHYSGGGTSIEARRVRDERLCGRLAARVAPFGYALAEPRSCVSNLGRR
jgi:CubicO group peptidase (beta-lactamase class C family)